MKTFFFCLALANAVLVAAQPSEPLSPADQLNFGVVLEHPDMEKVALKPGVTYMKTDNGNLDLDIYLPPGMAADEKRPAVVFLNAIGDRPGARKLKSWGVYATWPRLVAANGYIGISMDCDPNHVMESIKGVFDFLAAKGAQFQIDAGRLGVYAASANVGNALNYLMGEEAYDGIKAAVLYYGAYGSGPYRKDLPVYFVVAESDVRQDNYDEIWKQVLLNKAPWTIRMGSGMPHAFDTYTDTDEARRILKETLSFWKNELDPVPPHHLDYKDGRAMMTALRYDRDRALPLLADMAKKYPKDVQTLNLYAGELMRANRYKEAEQVYDNLLALDPKNTAAVTGKIIVDYAGGNQEKAETDLKAAVKAGLMDRASYTSLGYSLLVLDKNREAAGFYEKALAMGPNGGDYYNLGCAYAKMSNVDKAMEALELAVQYGYRNRQSYEHDPDLDSLRSDARFTALVKALE